MSRISIKEDKSGATRLVTFWISMKGNLCWKHNGKIYVKLHSGFTMMTEENESNWIPSNVHTRAKTQEVVALSNPQTRTEQVPLTFI